MTKAYTKVLTIAGSDSGGGAGIQADVKTISSLGCYAMTAITAITAQNTTGVAGIFPMSIDCVEQQIHAVLSDIGADAVKIGMLWSSGLARSVAGMLERHGVTKVVYDPVMVSQSGDLLLKEEDSRLMVALLAPHVQLITPNLSEASCLLGWDILDQVAMEKAAKSLVSFGCSNVLLKGGHLEGSQAIDVLYMAGDDDTFIFHEKRIRTMNNHGTGCTLSSAIASFLAKGHGIKAAVGLGKDYITRVLASGADYHIGKGHGPVHHFQGIWE
ncbi:MAG: bifunctional hydroxymethylpyrimidine kinase/phosphomethylpyrimidine kinase [Proteobacteria bacterium]|nr:bifunctional hydroxymethylpyrimidine kinase/phosphomethylpyrimidine kinase [Pseudomonadota bacterium]